MKLTSLRTVFVAALVASSLAAPFAIRHFAQIQWRDRDAALRQQDKRRADLKAENRRLSDLLKQKQDTPSLTREQFDELLRLRGEIGQLRQAAAEVKKLQSANQQLAVRAKEEAEFRSSTPDPKRVQAFWPKDQLAYVGYSNPASALETALWGMSRGDTNALLASVTPQAKAKLLRKGWYDRQSSEQELAKSANDITASLKPSSSFYLVGQKFVSPDFAILDVFFAGEGKTRKAVMEKIAGAWKFSQFGPVDCDDRSLTNGYGMWP